LISSQLLHIDTISECFYIQSPIEIADGLWRLEKEVIVFIDDHCSLYNDS